jgi:hypothetical protein
LAVVLVNVAATAGANDNIASPLEIAVYGDIQIDVPCSTWVRGPQNSGTECLDPLRVPLGSTPVKIFAPASEPNRLGSCVCFDVPELGVYIKSKTFRLENLQEVASCASSAFGTLSLREKENLLLTSDTADSFSRSFSSCLASAQSGSLHAFVGFDIRSMVRAKYTPLQCNEACPLRVGSTQSTGAAEIDIAKYVAELQRTYKEKAVEIAEGMVRTYVASSLEELMKQDGKVPYSMRLQEKASAVCINWDEFCYRDGAIKAFRWYSLPFEGPIHVWGSGQVFEDLSSAKLAAMKSCKSQAELFGCECRLLHVNDRVVLKVPGSVLERLNQEKFVDEFVTRPRLRGEYPSFKRCTPE